MARRIRKNFGNARIWAAAALRKKGVPRQITRCIRPPIKNPKDFAIEPIEIYETRTLDWIKLIENDIAPRGVDPYNPKRFKAALLLCWWIRATANPLVMHAQKKYDYFYCSNNRLIFTNNPRKATVIGAWGPYKEVKLTTHGDIMISTKNGEQEAYDLENLIKNYELSLDFGEK
jgi:hypothetical protein